VGPDPNGALDPTGSGGGHRLTTSPPPLPSTFLERLTELEAAYLRESDPIKQSGFHGGPDRWRIERAPILDAIPTNGDLLDIGCANGHLLECILQWAASERGLVLTPFGIDCSAPLIALARERLPHFRDNFYVANAWGWTPPRRFQYVYSVFDCVPRSALGAYTEQLIENVVAPGGRLILGAYGSRSRGEPPAPIDSMLTALGYEVAGSTHAGTPETARFAWINKP
jgi:SAM-dependent methyltransferase